MEISINFIGTMILVACVIAGAFWVAIKLYFSKYFEKKGKNLATKEDIREITLLTESVKIQLQSHFSKLSDWDKERKITILDFHDEYSYWINHSIKNISVVQNYKDETVKVREVIDELVNQHGKVERLFFRMSVFESDNEFLKEIADYVNNAYELHLLTLNFLLEIEAKAINIALYRSSKSVYELTNEVAEREACISKFITKRDELQGPILKSIGTVMALVRRKLSNLLNNK